MTYEQEEVATETDAEAIWNSRQVAKFAGTSLYKLHKIISAGRFVPQMDPDYGCARQYTTDEASTFAIMAAFERIGVRLSDVNLPPMVDISDAQHAFMVYDPASRETYVRPRRPELDGDDDDRSGPINFAVVDASRIKSEANRYIRDTSLGDLRPRRSQRKRAETR